MAEQLREGEARAIFRQVASGVAHLHSLGIAHRDLKPQNLMYISADEGAQASGAAACAVYGAAGAVRQGGDAKGCGGLQYRVLVPACLPAGNLYFNLWPATSPCPPACLQVKIMDYDLARVNYAPTWEGYTPCGTIHYM